MKKILSIFLVLCMCCGMITGCKKEMKVSADFNTETNQKEKVEECHYQIPAAWEKEGSTGDTTVFYYPDNGMLMVYYEEYEGGDLDDSLAQTYVRNFTSGWDKVELGEMEPIDLSGVSAYSQEWKFEADGVSYVSKTILFNCGSGILNFTMNTEKDSDISYAEDFSEILNSISVYLPFERTFSDVEEIIDILKSGGKNNFTTTGVDKLDDGMTMEIFIDDLNGTQITLIGDEDENLTNIHASAKDEAGIVSVSTTALMGADIISTAATDFLTNLSLENLEGMKSGAESALIETIDGVSYMLSKSETSTYLYSFDLQRDNSAKEDYEAYLNE